MSANPFVALSSSAADAIESLYKLRRALVVADEIRRELEPGHVCACYQCDPVKFPQQERQGEHHVAARWDERPFVAVYLNGVQLTGCLEAFASRDDSGEAWVISDHPAAFGPNRCNHPCMTKLRGQVSIVRAVPA
jgi:hypothetical protein